MKKYILDSETTRKKICRLALELIENNLYEKELILVGVKDNGVVLAKNIQERVRAESKIKTELLTLTLDKKHPGEIVLDKKMNFDGKSIILIDDVANSGRTLIYALKPFLAYHPKKIQTLVLVERTHNLFPIKPDYKGLSLATTLQDHIYVEVTEDKISGAYLD